MNRMRRAVRVFVFICIIVLAGVGVGLSGGVPLPTLKNRRDSERDNTELIENQDKKSDFQQGQIRG